MIKNFLKPACFIISATILTACSVLQSEKRVATPLRVEFTQWWGDYTLVIAQEKGFFEKYGVQVEPKYYEVYSNALPDLVTGQIDGALTSIGDVININANSPMKVVAVYDNGGDDAVMVGPEINSINDLKGKDIGFQVGSQYELTVIEMLRSANLSLGDVSIKEMNPEDAVSALKNNQVQAAYTWEPYLSEALSNGYKIIYPQEQLYLYPDTIVFRKSIVDERPDDVKAFMKAWFEAVDFRMKDPESARSIVADYLGVGIENVPPDDNLKILTLDDNRKLFVNTNNNSIYSVAKRTTDYLISIGALIQQTDPLALIDPAYLP